MATALRAVRLRCCHAGRQHCVSIGPAPAVATGWATALATVAIGFYVGAGWAVSLIARFAG